MARLATFEGAPSHAPRPASARALSTIYAAGTFAAALLVLLAADARRPTLIEQLFGLINVPVSSSLLSVVVLALVTRALIARKRVGLALVALFQAIGIAVGIATLIPREDHPLLDLWQSRGNFGRFLDIASILTGLVALFWLFTIRRGFPGRLKIRHAGWAAVTLVVGLLATVGVTALLLEYKESGPATPATVTRAVLAAFSGVSGGRPLADAPWIIHVTATLAAVTVLASAVVLLRPARSRSTWTGERELAIRSLIQRYGASDSLAYLATRRDRGAAFSSDRRAVVTYRVVGGVSLASADPIGAPDSWSSAIAHWLAESRTSGWTPAVLSASEAGARAYTKAGMRVGRMGDEAILTPESWDLSRPSMGPVVRAARHARRSGMTVSILHQEDMTAALLADVTRYAEEWRGAEPDRGFSMALNRPDDPADGRILHVLARDASGSLVGLLSFVPWGPAGISLDVMRRSPAAANGVTELMVATVMGQSRDLGIARVSLNFCMFRDVFEGADQIAAGSFVRSIAFVLGQLDRFWQLERLYRFNQRFEPLWVPRLYCYDDPASLVQVAVAAGMAEGFLPSFPKHKPHALELSPAETSRARALSEPLDHAGAPAGPRRTQEERVRQRHWQAMHDAGLDPNPPTLGIPTHRLEDLPGVWAPGLVVEVSARVKHLRDHGGVVFVTLTNAGQNVQAVLSRDAVGSTALEDVRRYADTGDLIRVTGALGESRNGTPSVLVAGWSMEAKSLRPVPFRGLDKPEARLRDRSADLVVHPAHAQVLRQRSAIIGAVRQVLVDEGYLEVDTPMLQAVHGGASARPFETWSNAYGLDLSLRIAPELYLKRLLVGGLGPIFEIGRNFRNEGADATHNPEFTSLEAYQPYGDYTTMRALTERLIRAAAEVIHGEAVVPLPTSAEARQGLGGLGGLGGKDNVALLDISGTWAVVPVLDAVSEALGIRVEMSTPAEELIRAGADHDLALNARMSVGAMIEEIYSKLVEPVTMRPTFFTDFPQETSPLTRGHRAKPGLVERWDLVIAGMEVATAYTELTDPVEQRRRLTAQSQKAAAGDPEAMQLDEDFLRAMELGMPSAGGLGIGMDRLVMLLTNLAIRSVLAFPFVRPDGPAAPATSILSEPEA